MRGVAALLCSRPNPTAPLGGRARQPPGRSKQQMPDGMVRACGHARMAAAVWRGAPTDKPSSLSSVLLQLRRCQERCVHCRQEPSSQLGVRGDNGLALLALP